MKLSNSELAINQLYVEMTFWHVLYPNAEAFRIFD